ncbi:unnamed protein product [Lepeophtheirus salmonis]|uniref:(salmon louse) hypothetical protein n=1 Tax=Lepeophtheirus salmonis TaxID=72036 RepID=A0A7R8CSB6_LEPSM|nr:unnamed protein product [Lepeophtheirus salmonis]CAF2915281.1 unnamed protein product [Lepeophtheirus salmonis]
MDSTNYSIWNLLVLRRELNKRDAKISWRKSDQIDRLVSYQRNADFVGPVVQIPDMAPMSIWRDSGDFKGIVESDRKSIPPITKAQIEHYVIYRQRIDDVQTSLKMDVKIKEGLVSKVARLNNEDQGSIPTKGQHNPDMVSQQLWPSFNLGQFGQPLALKITPWTTTCEVESIRSPSRLSTQVLKT